MSMNNRAFACYIVLKTHAIRSEMVLALLLLVLSYTTAYGSIYDDSSST
jgi:hypothetical protein